MASLRVCVSFGWLALLSVPALAAGNVSITWQNATFPSTKLPADMPEPARAAIGAWEKWAVEHEYRMTLDPGARLLLVTPADRSIHEKQIEIVARTCKWFDELLPVPDRTPQVQTSEASSKAPPQKAPDVIPEDPESPPVAAPPPKPIKTEPAKKVTSWGAVQPDSQTGVMLVLRNEKEYATALDELGRTHVYLKDWLVSARKNTGFVLEQPLCGAYIESASGQEEWSPEHELLNRVTQMLLVSRFGQLPNWLVQGVAWESELAFDETVYCFPYRDEFVFTVEHGAWPNDVKNKFKDRASDPLKMEEFALWKRGTYEHDAAQTAWGVTRYLATAHKKQFASALEEFRQTWDAQNRKTKSDGTWERMKDFQLPANAQLKILTKHTDADFLKRATTWLGKQDPTPTKS